MISSCSSATTRVTRSAGAWCSRTRRWRTLRANDPKSADQIEAGFAHWDDIDVHIHGQTITSSGHGFVGIGRKRLLNILAGSRPQELGVRLEFRTEVDPSPELFANYDLVLACDGANSKLRTADAEHFGVDIDIRPNKYIWLGADKAFDAFTFAFEQTEHGWIWAHAYKFDDNASTFIVECSEATWRSFGFDTMSQDETCRAARKALRQISRRRHARHQRQTLARLRLAQLPAHCLRDVAQGIT